MPFESVLLISPFHRHILHLAVSVVSNSGVTGKLIVAGLQVLGRVADRLHVVVARLIILVELHLVLVGNSVGLVNLCRVLVVVLQHTAVLVGQYVGLLEVKAEGIGKEFALGFLQGTPCRLDRRQTLVEGGRAAIDVGFDVGIGIVGSGVGGKQGVNVALVFYFIIIRTHLGIVVDAPHLVNLVLQYLQRTPGNDRPLDEVVLGAFLSVIIHRGTTTVGTVNNEV